MSDPVETGSVTLLSQVAEQEQGRESSAAPPSPARALSAAMLRPAPQRLPELAHMDLKRLRAYRRTLLEEELRTSYWRRLIQARRDLLRMDGSVADHAALTEALTEQRAANGRQAILSLHPDGGMPILPHLPDLWASGAADDADRAELSARLASAESVLSSYREALHKRLDRATAELVARYHEDPAQCLAALPVDA